MLTLEAGQTLGGAKAQLPLEASARVAHLDDVEQVAHTALLKDTYVYPNPMIPVGNTRGLQVRATS